MDSTTEHAIRTLVAERDELKQHCLRLQGLMDCMGYPPGHHYSPVVDIGDSLVAGAVNDRLTAQELLAIDLDRHAMIRTMRKLAAHQGKFVFERDSGSRHRYNWGNPFFGSHDAAVYFCMLLEFRPKRVIEVGCGFSSRLLLDTSEQFFDSSLEVTLIDPELGTIDGLNPAPQTETLTCRLQETPLSMFDRLESGDILFIDSSHVCKTGSDVNHYLFQILPRLRKGVLVHIHDIFYPFEYPASWVLTEKRSWNEAYLLRSFLQFNSSFRILYWNNFAFHFLHDELAALMPSCLENEGGSLWITRT